MAASRQGSRVDLPTIALSSPCLTGLSCCFGGDSMVPKHTVARERVDDRAVAERMLVPPPPPLSVTVALWLCTPLACWSPSSLSAYSMHAVLAVPQSLAMQVA